MISAEQILEAKKRIDGYVHQTAVLTNSFLNELTNTKLFFKCENFQKVGAFKARGASNFALQLSDRDLENGLCTHSSGNHAQAVAYIAQRLNSKAYIVMPENAPQVKIDAVKEYGAEITFCKPTLQARESELNRIQGRTNAIFMPPYNHEKIIAGAATAALELIESTNLDCVLAPIGGGGLLAGTCLSAKYFGNQITVYGAEPAGADDAKRSLDARELIPSINPDTIADGLLTSVGEINFSILSEELKDILVVNDEEIRNAMKLIWQRMKIIVEPSSATVLAAVLKYPKPFANKNVGLILSGGNVDLSRSFF